MTFPKLRGVLAPALSMAAFACASVAGQDGRAPEAGLACTVDVVARGGSLTVEGVVVADEPVTGRYQLLVSNGGSRLSQEGMFRLEPGETHRLGHVTTSGSARAVDAALTLDIRGRSVTCPTRL